MTDEILPMGYPPNTRRVCQPYIDQIAVLSARFVDADAEIERLRKELLRLETYFDIDPEEYAALPSDDHRADNDRQLILIRKALGAKP